MQQKTEGALRLECSDCGGVLEIVDNTHATCPHCGQKYQISNDGVLTVDIHVDAKGLEPGRLWLYKELVGITALVLLSVLLIIVGANRAARNSEYASQEQVREELGEQEVLKQFFEDVLDKEYEELTPEDFARIKYIKYEKNTEYNEAIAKFYYSFTDYRDCKTEEEFQESVKEWSHVERMGWFEDYTDFIGVTRMDFTLLAIGPDGIRLPENAPISCIYSEDMEGLSYVNDTINLENIEVLHIIDGPYAWREDSLTQVQNYPNLKELVINCPLDATNIGVCQDLKVLQVEGTVRNAEKISGLTQLESLCLGEGTVWQDVDFSQLTNLEELSVWIEGDEEISEDSMEANSVEEKEEADWFFLSKLPKLRKLHILGDGFVPVSVTEYIPKVEELTISLNQPESIGELIKLQELKKLKLYLQVPEKVIKTEPLSTAEEITWAAADRSEWIVTDVSVLATIPQLTEVELVVTDEVWNLASVKGMEDLWNAASLQRISLEGAACFVDFEQLEENSSVKELLFYNCNVLDYKIVEDLMARGIEYPDISKDELLPIDCLQEYFPQARITVREMSIEEQLLNEIKDLEAQMNRK